MVARAEGVYKPRFLKRVRLPAFAIPVPAGEPEIVESYIKGYIDPTELLIRHPSSTFFIRVKGDSMITDGIYPGDWLVVDRSVEAVEGRIIVATVDNELTIKRFQRKGRCIWLVPSNENYPPIQVRKGQDFEVWGVVMWTLHKHS